METADLLNRLRDLTIGRNLPDEGWKSAIEWAQEWKVPETTCRRYLKAAVDNGLMEKRMYKPRDGGRVRTGHFKERVCDDSIAATGCGKTSGTGG